MLSRMRVARRQRCRTNGCRIPIEFPHERRAGALRSAAAREEQRSEPATTFDERHLCIQSREHTTQLESYSSLAVGRWSQDHTACTSTITAVPSWPNPRLDGTMTFPIARRLFTDDARGTKSTIVHNLGQRSSSVRVNELGKRPAGHDCRMRYIHGFLTIFSLSRTLFAHQYSDPETHCSQNLPCRKYRTDTKHIIPPPNQGYAA